MVVRRAIVVNCRCGERLARYRKGGKGRLVKMFLDRILLDPHRIFLTKPPLALNQDIPCPSCGKRVATVQIVRGKYAAKMNQGGIRQP